MQFLRISCVTQISMKADSEKTRLFNDIVTAHRRIIYKVCYMYATDSEHLKDLFQEVSANIWSGLGSFRGDAQLSTWVYRVALNTCITYYRRNDRHHHNISIDEVPDIADANDSSERNAMLRQMYELIASLGKIDKALIMLWLDEYSYDEIAHLTGLTRNNVASRLLRARRQLVKLSNE